MIQGNKIAIFNRIYTGRNEPYVIEFNNQLEFFKKDNKIYSNRYDITLNTGLSKDVFYKCIQDILNIKYDNNELDDITTFTKEEWEANINE